MRAWVEDGERKTLALRRERGGLTFPCPPSISPPVSSRPHPLAPNTNYDNSLQQQQTRKGLVTDDKLAEKVKGYFHGPTEKCKDSSGKDSFKCKAKFAAKVEKTVRATQKKGMTDDLVVAYVKSAAYIRLPAGLCDSSQLVENGGAGITFTIRHFAGCVEYMFDDFLEKNKVCLSLYSRFVLVLLELYRLYCKRRKTLIASLQ